MTNVCQRSREADDPQTRRLFSEFRVSSGIGLTRVFAKHDVNTLIAPHCVMHIRDASSVAILATFWGRKKNFTNSKTLVGRCRDRP